MIPCVCMKKRNCYCPVQCYQLAIVCLSGGGGGGGGGAGGGGGGGEGGVCCGKCWLIRV